MENSQCRVAELKAFQCQRGVGKHHVRAVTPLFTVVLEDREVPGFSG